MARLGRTLNSLLRCMKTLIDIYYKLADNPELPILEIELFLQTAFKPILPKYLKPAAGEFIKMWPNFLAGDIKLEISPSVIQSFLKIMAELEKSTQNGHQYHFLFDPVDPDGFYKKRFPSVLSPECQSFDFDYTSLNTSQKFSKIDDICIEIPGKDPLSIGLELYNKNETHWIPIKPLTDFAQLLLNADPKETPFNHIPIFSSDMANSFIRLLRSTFVTFQFAFCGFNKIRCCKSCQKLVVPFKINDNSFCNSSCRSASFSKTDPDEKKKCRARQNKWFINQELKNRLYVDDCKDCTLRQKGGHCKIAITKMESSRPAPKRK